MARKLGMEGKLYFTSAGGPLPGTPAWTLAGNVRDVALNMDTGEADVTTRGNNGWKAKVGTLKDGSVDFESIWDPSDPFFGFLFAAFMNKTAIGLAIMDGDITVAGSEGLVGDFAVIKCTRDEKLEDAMKAQITVSLTYSATAPVWLVVA